MHTRLPTVINVQLPKYFPPSLSLGEVQLPATCIAICEVEELRNCHHVKHNSTNEVRSGRKEGTELEPVQPSFSTNRLTLWESFTAIPMIAQRDPPETPCLSEKKR